MSALPQDELYTIKYVESLPEGQRAELLDGELYDLAAPAVVHQQLIAQLTRVIGNHIDAHNGRCRVFPAPFAVYPNGLDDEYNYLEPDISVVCDTQKLENGKGCDGAPDWVIEVTSPSTRSRDYLYKLDKYRQAGVKEYWIINPDTRNVMVYDFMQKNGSDNYTFEDRIPARVFSGLYIKPGSLM